MRDQEVLLLSHFSRPIKIRVHERHDEASATRLRHAMEFRANLAYVLAVNQQDARDDEFERSRIVIQRPDFLLCEFHAVRKRAWRTDVTGVSLGGFDVVEQPARARSGIEDGKIFTVSNKLEDIRNEASFAKKLRVPIARCDQLLVCFG